MIAVVLFGMKVIPVNLESKLSCIMFISINAIVGALVYIFIAYKMGIFTSVFGEKYINKIKRKIFRK